ncbi:hypothetical protein V5O48_014936 [Marasmius crinis-equi]|uniref:RRM domain-containing protein n=1 Tax=Marasmius crinis-equi TaxID=585013 RepID=A0ABR3EW81_9AGAR
MLTIRVPRHHSNLFNAITVRFYHHPTRCIRVSFKPENRTKNRKSKLLGLADTYGPVHNLFGEPEGNAFDVEFFDVDTARRFRKDVERRLSTVEAKFSRGVTARTPNESTTERIWRGRSRTLLFVPNEPEKLTPETIKATLCTMHKGFELANVLEKKTSFQITFYTMVDALAAWTICKNEKLLPGSLGLLPFNDPWDQPRPGISQMLESQLVRRSLVVSDLSLTEDIGTVLCVMTAGCLVESSRYDSENRTMTLTFISQQHMEDCYNSSRSRNRPSRINPDTISKAPFLDFNLPFHRQLAVALGMSSSIIVELPREVLEVGGTRDAVNRRAVVQTIRYDFARYGTLGYIDLHTDKRCAYVNFLDMSAAAEAYWHLHRALRTKSGPLVKYTGRSGNYHMFLPERKDLATYRVRNLQAHLITD